MQRLSCLLRYLYLWIALTALAACSSATVARLDWRYTGGPGDLQIRALLFAPHDPATLYAGVSGYGFHRSTDGGQSWQTFTTGFSMLPGLPIDPNALNLRALLVSQQDSNLLLAGSEGGIHRSVDQGENWSPVQVADEVADPELFTGFYLVDALTSTLNDGEEHFFAGTKGGLFRLDPATDRWQPVDEMTGPGYRVSAILLDPLEQHRLTVATFAEGIWQSDDGGLVWRQIGQSFAEADIWCNKLAWDSAGRLLVGTFGDGVYRLEDDGWTSISQGLPEEARIWSLLADETSPVIYAGVADDLTYRREGEGDWQPLSLPFGAYALARQPQTGQLFLGTRGNGAWASTDGESGWQRLAVRPLERSALNVTRAIALADGSLIAGTENNGVFVLAADGRWIEGAGIDLQHRKILSLAQGQAQGADNPRLYAGTVSGGVYASQDGGYTWTQLPLDGLTDESARKVTALLAFADGTGEGVYAGSFAGLYRLAVNASQWEEVWGLMGQTGQQVKVTALERGFDGAIYAAINSQGIWRSPNGEEWESVTANRLKDPAFVKNLRAMGTTGLDRLIHGPPRLFAADYNSIYSSVDGETWIPRISGPYHSLVIDPAHPQIAYTAPVTTTLSAEVITATFPALITLNSGVSWQTVDEEPAALSVPIAELAMQPGTGRKLFAATSSGVYTGDVTLPPLWREIGGWAALCVPLFLLVGLLLYAWLTLGLPYGVPLPTALGLLLFQRQRLALVLADPSSLSSLQQLILAFQPSRPGLALGGNATTASPPPFRGRAGGDQGWTLGELAAALDRQNANASRAQLAAAVEQLTDQFRLLRWDGKERYQTALPGVERIFRGRVQRNRDLLAKDVREENAIFQNSREFFRQAGFGVHARRDILLLTPLQEAWSDLAGAADGSPLLARILAGRAPTVADIDETRQLVAAEFNGDVSGRLVFLAVSAAPATATRQRIAQLHREEGLALVLLSHTAIYQALGEGAASTSLQLALRRHRGEISPAELSGPIFDPLDFFDRGDLLAQVRESLAGGQALLLTGSPQIGKSSLVWQAAQQLDNHLVSYAEFRPGPAWEAEMLGDLLDGLVQDGDGKYPRTEWPFDPFTVRTSAASMADFTGLASGMAEAISLAETRPRLALLVDGLDEATIGWWGELIAACRRQPDLQIGLVGVAVPGLTLPARQRVIRLGPFAPAAAQEMAGALADQVGVAIDDSASYLLATASGGHPFLLRRLFGQAQLEAETRRRQAEAGATAIDDANVTAGLNRDVQSSGLYGRWWMALSPAEQATVIDVAEGRTLTPADGPSAEALMERGWLRPDPAGGYALLAGVLADWLVWMGLADVPAAQSEASSERNKSDGNAD